MVSDIDPNATEAQTKTVPYGGGNTNNPGPNANSPSINDLATQSVEEEMGPDAHNNPTFKDRVENKVKQMLDAIEQTKGM